MLRALRRERRNLRHVLIVGTGDLAEQLVARKMVAEPDFGLSVIGLVSRRADGRGRAASARAPGDRLGRRSSGSRRAGARRAGLRRARRSEWHEAELEALDRLADSTAAVRLVPDLARAHTLNASVEDFDGMPVVLVTETPEQGWNAVLKRGFDLAASAVGLIVLSPLLALLALWVRLGSPGPVLYAQERVGVNGRRFRMLKFRTMRVDAEADGPGGRRPDDPRRTRAGRRPAQALAGRAAAALERAASAT